MPKGELLFAAIVAAGCSGGSTAEGPASPSGGDAYPTSVRDNALAASDAAEDGSSSRVDGANPATEAGRGHGHAQRCYSVRLLGTLGGANSFASGINERGEVIGTSDTATGEQHAFLWSCGELHDLGTLGGASSVPNAINDHGVVVGSSMLADGSTHAFLWRNGFMTDLGTPPGLPNSTAVSVNDRGQVVGNSGFGETSSLLGGFIWEHGRMRQLPPLIDGAVAQAVFITESGRIFGHSNGFDQDFFSVVEWHHDRIRRLVVGAVINGASNRGVVGESVVGGLPFIWLDGQLFRTSFEPLGINDRGQVVGTNQNGDAVLWDHGDVTDLGTGSARLINNRGEIVIGGGVWFKGVVTELPQPSEAAADFTEVTGINDAGEVIGIAVKNAPSELIQEAILWRPSRCHH